MAPLNQHPTFLTTNTAYIKPTLQNTYITHELMTIYILYNDFKFATIRLNFHNDIKHNDTIIMLNLVLKNI